MEKNPKLVVFGDNIAYRCGGAEESMFSLLSQLKGIDINIVSRSNISLSKKYIKYQYTNLTEISLTLIKPLPYLQYFLNSIQLNKFSKYFLNGDILFSQGLIAPAAINKFKNPSIYLFRDEINLNICRCYETSLFKKIKFSIRFILQVPFFWYFCYTNKNAIDNSKLLIANSEYVAKKINKIFNKRAFVFYPTIELTKLRNVTLPALEKRYYILLVGDEGKKGISIFRKIARSLHNQKFLVIGKNCINEVVGNISYRQYIQNTLDIYKMAKIVLMPSLWEEAFGRVAVEASTLGIPVLVSNRGGLPETVPSEYVINDYHNIKCWTEKISWILSNYESHSRIMKAYTKKFDNAQQIKLLVNEIYKTTDIKISI